MRPAAWRIAVSRSGFVALNYSRLRGLSLFGAGAVVPIVMMTGLEDVASINRAYDVGATDFETKPINYAALPHRARYILRSARNAQALRDSEARLDEAQRLARLGHFDWYSTSGRLEMTIPPGCCEI